MNLLTVILGMVCICSTIYQPTGAQRRGAFANHNRNAVQEALNQLSKRRPPPPPVRPGNNFWRPPPPAPHPGATDLYGRPTRSSPVPNRWNQFGGGGAGHRHWQHAHHPTQNHYRDFVSVFREIDQKAEPISFNSTAEDAEVDDDFNGRSIVAPGQYPHMAAIGFRSNAERVTYKCGGSLISESYVLTAAHCCEVSGEAPYIVKMGDINLRKFERELRPQLRRVAQYYLFPEYNSSKYYHDIALIQLERPIEYTEFVRPIRLWASGHIPYEKVFTMGYGSTSFAQAPTNILTELDLTVVPLDRCNQSMPLDDSAPDGIIESQICAKDFEKNRDTCQGDSGGPLQLNLERRRRRKRYRYYLVGIISYGQFCRGSLPGVYTRVSSYIDWIASIVWPQYFQKFEAQ